jgi:hypothetical protein
MACIMYVCMSLFVLLLSARDYEFGGESRQEEKERKNR